MIGDITERTGYDFEQLKSIAKVQVSHNARLLVQARLANLLTVCHSPPRCWIRLRQMRCHR
jgi:hypothetical protein